jgi:hypothetical protein
LVRTGSWVQIPLRALIAVIRKLFLINNYFLGEQLWLKRHMYATSRT